MRLCLAIAASAILARPSSAQHGLYSDIGSVEEFTSLLEVNAAAQANVSAILNAFEVGSTHINTTERAHLACNVGRVVFGSKLYSVSSAKYGDLIDNNW